MKYVLILFALLITSCSEIAEQDYRATVKKKSNTHSDDALPNKEEVSITLDQGCAAYFSKGSDPSFDVSDIKENKISLCSIFHESSTQSLLLIPWQKDCGDCTQKIERITQELQGTGIHPQLKLGIIFSSEVDLTQIDTLSMKTLLFHDQKNNFKKKLEKYGNHFSDPIIYALTKNSSSLISIDLITAEPGIFKNIKIPNITEIDSSVNTSNVDLFLSKWDFISNYSDDGTWNIVVP